MTKTCVHCGTQIPFIAARCPNCTTQLSGAGGSGGDAGTAFAIIIFGCVFGIGNCLGCIK